MFVFNVPPTAKVIWRRGHGLKSHPTDWWSRESNLRPLVYKASGLSTTPQRLLFNSLHSGKFFILFCHLLIFFKINFFEKFFQEYHQSVNKLDPDQIKNDDTFVILLISSCCLFSKLLFSKNCFRNGFKQFGFRSGPTFCRSWSGS